MSNTTNKKRKEGELNSAKPLYKEDTPRQFSDPSVYLHLNPEKKKRPSARLALFDEDFYKGIVETLENDPFFMRGDTFYYDGLVWTED